jgi:hypothetical protein
MWTLWPFGVAVEYTSIIASPWIVTPGIESGESETPHDYAEVRHSSLYRNASGARHAKKGIGALRTDARDDNR